MSKRKKHKKNRKNKTHGDSNRKREEAPRSEAIMNIPGIWEVMIGISLLLIGAGLSYFTGNPRILYVGAIGVCVLIFYATHCLVLHFSTKNSQSPKIVYFGGFTPANDPSIPLPAGVPPDTVQLLLGDDLRILSSSSNPVFSKGGKAFLSIGIRDGLMRITTILLDKNNQWVCRIIDNEFQVSQERSFNPKQPDQHSLIVRDADGIEILSIRFVNPKTMWIIGRFQLPGSLDPVLILRQEGIRWPGGGGIGHLTLDMTKSKGGAIAF